MAGSEVEGRIETKRLKQLDGLRGLAALVVVIHHSLMVSPTLAAVYRDASARKNQNPGEWTWWLTTTPLHLFWDGPAAVILFFVLSGFVLSVPFTGEARANWWEYFSKRLVRLYLPVWASVVLALGFWFLFRPAVRPDQSWLVNAQNVTLTLRSVVNDLILIRGADMLNGPLWSLRWEVLFSLLLPLYLYLARRFGRYWLVLIGVNVMLTLVGPTVYAMYLPIFAIGVVMAVRRDVLDLASNKIVPWVWPLVLIGALALLNASWYSVKFRGEGAVTLIGATLLLFVFYGWSGAIRLAVSSPAQWLGSRSFSLYLVHWPITVSIALAAHWTNPVLLLAATLPVSLLVSEGFFRVVEQPSHQASRAVGRWCGAERASRWQVRRSPANSQRAIRGIGDGDAGPAR